MKRPVGVSVLGWILLICAIFILFPSIMSLLSSKNVAKLFFLMLILFGIFLVILALDILHLKLWARKTIVFVSAILLIVDVINLLLAHKANSLSLSLFAGVYLYYFTRPKVKDQFKL